MTKQDIVSRLKKAYEAEDCFPGVLGNPSVFASRWGLHTRGKAPTVPARKKAESPSKPGCETIAIREGIKTKWVRISTGDSVSIHTATQEGGKRHVRVITGVVIGTRGRDLKQSVTMKTMGENALVVTTPVGRISKVKIKRRSTRWKRSSFSLDKELRKISGLVKRRLERPGKKRLRKLKTRRFSAMLAARCADF